MTPCESRRTCRARDVLHRGTPGIHITSLSLATLLLTATLAVADEIDRTGKVRAAAIDAAFDKQWRDQKVTPSALADDAEFLRRVCLDITGQLPSAARAAAFLDDPRDDKRSRLIDELLAAPNYGRYFGRTWRNLMIRPDANMPNPPNPGPLTDWLATRFNENRG